MGPIRTRRTTTTRTVALVLAAGLTALHGAAFARPQAARPTPRRLAGITRVTGSETTATWVTITKEARLEWRRGANPDVRIEGAGRLAGVVLTQEPLDDPNRPFLIAARTAFCDTRGCASDDTYQWVSAHVPGASQREWVVLQPGRYLLYLLADGAPVTVTLRLHGLSGETEVSPETVVDAQVGAPSAETEFVGPERKAYWFGQSGTIDAGVGLVGGIMRIEAEEWVQGSHSSCLQRELRSPELVAYSPACPAGGAARVSEGSTGGPGGRAVHANSVWNVSPGGDWGLGMNYVAAAEVSDVAAVTFFLPFQVPPA